MNCCNVPLCQRSRIYETIIHHLYFHFGNLTFRTGETKMIRISITSEKQGMSFLYSSYISIVLFLMLEVETIAS